MNSLDTEQGKKRRNPLWISSIFNAVICQIILFQTEFIAICHQKQKSRDITSRVKRGIKRIIQPTKPKIADANEKNKFKGTFAIYMNRHVPD